MDLRPKLDQSSADTSRTFPRYTAQGCQTITCRLAKPSQASLQERPFLPHTQEACRPRPRLDLGPLWAALLLLSRAQQNEPSSATFRRLLEQADSVSVRPPRHLMRRRSLHRHEMSIADSKGVVEEDEMMTCRTIMTTTTTKRTKDSCLSPSLSNAKRNRDL